jgi:hypothetical protein
MVSQISRYGIPNHLRGSSSQLTIQTNSSSQLKTTLLRPANSGTGGNSSSLRSSRSPISLSRISHGSPAIHANATKHGPPLTTPPNMSTTPKTNEHTICLAAYRYYQGKHYADGNSWFCEPIPKRLIPALLALNLHDDEDFTVVFNEKNKIVSVLSNTTINKLISFFKNSYTKLP